MFKDIVFVWDPWHVGIQGNTAVDLVAKHTQEKPINKTQAFLYSDCKVLANMYINQLWKMEWERHAENKLYKVQPKVDDPIPSHGRCRPEESGLCRLHVGHTVLAHIY